MVMTLLTCERVPQIAFKQSKTPAPASEYISPNLSKPKDFWNIHKRHKPDAGDASKKPASDSSRSSEAYLKRGQRVPLFRPRSSPSSTPSVEPKHTVRNFVETFKHDSDHLRHLDEPVDGKRHVEVSDHRARRLLCSEARVRGV